MKKSLCVLFLLVVIFCPIIVEASCSKQGDAIRQGSIFGNYVERRAGDAEEAVSQKRAVLVCEYGSSNISQGVRIYYHFKTTEKFSSTDSWKDNWSGRWIFHYRKSNKWEMIHPAGGTDIYGCGTFNDILMNNGKADDGRISYNFDEGNYSLGENKFVCPDYAFFDSENKYEICIIEKNTDDKQESCGTKFEDDEKLVLVKNNDSIFNLIDKYIGTTIWSDQNTFSLNNLKQRSLEYLVQTSVVDYINSKYFNDGQFEKPQFIYNYINNNYALDEKINYESFQSFQKAKFAEIDSAVASGTLTEEESTQIKNKITNFYDVNSEINIKSHEEQKKGGYDVEELPSGFTTDWHDDFTQTCKKFASALRILGVLLFIAKILLPIVLIVKASLDLASTVTSGDASGFNKKVQKIVYSLVAGVAIFFIPTIVNIAFGFIADYSSGITDDSKVCSACLLNPFDLTCTQYADKK